MVKKGRFSFMSVPSPASQQKLPPQTDQDPALLASEGANVTADWGTDHMIHGREGADGKGRVGQVDARGRSSDDGRA